MAPKKGLCLSKTISISPGMTGGATLTTQDYYMNCYNNLFLDDITFTGL
jgi:hypothetical protein